MNQILVGVSTRGYDTSLDAPPPGVRSRGTSRSAVSRHLVARTSRGLRDQLARRLDDVRLAVLMLDGLNVGEHTVVVALGVTPKGVKMPLGLWVGSTENARVCTDLLQNIIERGLKVDDPVLCVIARWQRAPQGAARRLGRPRRRSAAIGTRSIHNGKVPQDDSHHLIERDAFSRRGHSIVLSLGGRFALKNVAPLLAIGGDVNELPRLVKGRHSHSEQIRVPVIYHLVLLAVNTLGEFSEEDPDRSIFP